MLVWCMACQHGRILDRESIVEANKELYYRWLDMWNGQLSIAQDIIAPGCIVHQAPFGAGEPPEFRGPDGIALMVRMGRAPFDDIRFELEVGPIVEGDKITARWCASGRYVGGLPSATVPLGTPVTFCGMDICRVEDGRFVEYWVSSDGAHLMAQLGMMP